MTIDPELKRAHGELSALGRRFLEFVERNPEAARRSSFGELDRPTVYAPFPLLSWPFFVDAEAVAAMRRLAVELPRLVRSLPERVFGNDIARIKAFYGLDPRLARLLGHVIGRSEIVTGALARTDFMLTRRGFQAMELNVTSLLGGWQASRWADDYLGNAVVRRFLQEEGVQVRIESPLDVLFSYVLEASCGLAGDGEVNVALTWPAVEDEMPPEVESAFAEAWHGALEQSGRALKGDLFLIDQSLVRERSGACFLDGRRVHAVVEYGAEPTATPILRAWLAGGVSLFSGPTAILYHDKRNVALLSELAGSDLFDAEERALLEAHVPWTRLVKPGATDFQGGETAMEEVLRSRREQLVLKPGIGSQGIGVYVGLDTSEEAWRKASTVALAEGGWVVQEYLEPVSLACQLGESGWGPATVVWGFFGFGSHFGGGFLRAAARGSQYVINSSQGALEGIFLEEVS